MAIVRERFQLVQEPVDVLPTPSALREGLCQAGAAIVTLGDHIDAETIQTATRLKILANYAVGYNNIDLAAAQRRGLIVTNTPDVLTDATADLTWALILATARRVVEGDTLVRSGQWTGWSPTQLLGTGVSGKTLGIIGMGRIGQAVAQRAVGFRMAVRYHARQPMTASSLSHEWELRSLRNLLEEADIVTIHVPLTTATRHLIGARELAWMKPTAFLINTARGPIVDEGSLVEALKKGTIAGAGLDVYEQEPALHPELAQLKQVVLLPHLGSATVQARIKMGLVCVKNIDAVLEGQPAPNRVQS
ncbi:MAG: D-glycerate dehydrogenase [Nitrospirota bacterium]|nr:D-glycerate dehydrogenase [Nitrospirota bacterium]MDP2384692.1 D-glycerate dehydrogenase [Nitrospirota bacterium]MDP3597176.1 D-glycerate dehydrogenase [Nitrospirota bacterium]